MKPLDPLAVSLTGTRLIEASAGTGKTFAITTLYTRLVIERGLGVSEILVVTYTRAATAELRDRIRGRLRQALTAMSRASDPEDSDLDRMARASVDAGTDARDRDRLRAALRSFDQAAIYTIHSFCQRTLQDSAFESGMSFDTEFLTDQGPLVTEIAQDFWAQEIYDAPEVFVRSLQHPRKPVTPALMAELARKAVASREMQVLPPRPRFDHTAGARWSDARGRAAAIWSAEREHILDLLATSAALNKSRYKAVKIRGEWAQAMDGMLAPDGASGAIALDVLGKFSATGIASGCKKNCAAPTHALFAICDEMLDALASFSQRELALLLDLTTYAREQLAARKAAARMQSFDDLLYQLRDALRGPGGKTLAATIRTRFRAALIDEFQDTDAVQYEVFRTVYQNTDDTQTCLFLIGDPKQAIYAFRGADVFTYMLARRDAGDACNTLATNWRSDPSLIRGINALFERASDPFILGGIEFAPVSPRPGSSDGLGGALAGTAPLQLLFVPRDGRTGARENLISKSMAQGELPEGIAGQIAELLRSDATIEGRPASPGDIAVLCRTNRQATHMQEALRELAVPSVLEGDASVFDSEQAAALLRVLTAMIEPGDTAAVRAALVTTMMGVSGDELCALQGDEDEWDRWLQLFRSWQRTWHGDGFIQAFRRMIADHAVDQRLLEFADGERALTNLYHLGELLQSEVMTSRAGPQALVRWFRIMCSDRNARADAVGDSAQLRLESDADAVKLVTIHKSKGLEYPIVYCPFLWDGKLLRMNDGTWIRFHDADDDNRLKLDLGGDDHETHKQLAEREALAENLRLLYVALTRAKHRCTVVWGAFNEAGTSPLAYLLHQPETLSTDPAGLKELASHVKKLTDDQMTGELEQLAKASKGAIALDYFALDRTSPLASPTAPTGSLSCRVAKRSLHAAGRMSSFSALVASEIGVTPPHVAPPHVAPPQAAPPATSEAPPLQVPLHDFPGGTRAGSMFHRIFETIDFRDPDPASLAAAADEALARSGYDPALSVQLTAAIGDVLRTPLPGMEPAFALADVPRHQRIVELEFTFPVGTDDAAMTARSLADAFRSRSAAPWAASYPDRLARLGFRPLDGYLRGFADLVFRRDDRWYLVDYKSNFLGPNAADYEPARLAAHMEHHHYFLQYHVYLVALHRYLRLRLRDYDYERHFGGVYYLFLRGMNPAHPPGCGVFRDRPQRAFMDRLSALVGEPSLPGVHP